MGHTPTEPGNTAALTRIATFRFDAAFQLTDHKMDARYPLLTLRRQITNPPYGISGFQRQTLRIDTLTSITYRRAGA